MLVEETIAFYYSDYTFDIAGRIICLNGIICWENTQHYVSQYMQHIDT